ncbi:cytidine deaminase-like protein [Hysterangium stoloniferum]|nr:cytidine deaminase-like protein [Hysterangium stoloniferum]
MFIAIIGTRASGKSAVEQYLISKHKFQPIVLNVSNTTQTLTFEKWEPLLTYVTQHWQESFVTCDLDTPQLIEQFIKRPFFQVVSVDAPLLTLALHETFRTAHVRVINSFTTLPDLYVHLGELNLTDSDRLRPRWDTYFMTLATLASHRSNCMKRRVGAILVRDKRIVATGYNGTPRNVQNCNEGGCKRCNSGGRSGDGLDECLCLHAEENALLEAGRERIGIGAILYCNTCPCLGCAIKIVQTGVKEVVYNLSYKVDDCTEALFNEAGVIIRQHSPPQ